MFLLDRKERHGFEHGATYGGLGSPGRCSGCLCLRLRSNGSAKPGGTRRACFVLRGQRARCAVAPFAAARRLRRCLADPRGPACQGPCAGPGAGGAGVPGTRTHRRSRRMRGSHGRLAPVRPVCIDRPEACCVRRCRPRAPDGIARARLPRGHRGLGARHGCHAGRTRVPDDRRRAARARDHEGPRAGRSGEVRGGPRLLGGCCPAGFAGRCVRSRHRDDELRPGTERHRRLLGPPRARP